MEPLLIVLVPGVLGGIILAALLATKRINLPIAGVERPLEPPSPSLINMAHIPVGGGGGLGIVAAVIAVALAEPRIRVPIGIAALLGAALAWALIVRRRRRGPLASAGDDSGPHSTLGLGREQQPDGRPVRSNGPRNHLTVSEARPGDFRLAADH
jgi:hypothetical protein